MIQLPGRMFVIYKLLVTMIFRDHNFFKRQAFFFDSPGIPPANHMWQHFEFPHGSIDSYFEGMPSALDTMFIQSSPKAYGEIKSGRMPEKNPLLTNILYSLKPLAAQLSTGQFLQIFPTPPPQPPVPMLILIP